MADINWSKHINTTYSSSTSGSGSTTGTEANCHDENDTTYLRRYGGGSYWVGSVHTEFQVNFPVAPPEIHEIKGLLLSTYKKVGSGAWSIQYYNGSWNTLASGGWTGTGITPYTSDTTGLTLTEVTAVKVVVDTTCSSYSPPPSYLGYAYADVWELYVYGEPPITTSIKNYSGVARTSIKKASGVTIANVKKLMGVS